VKGVTPSDDGFVAIEWVAAVAFLLLPVVCLAATLPAWAERRHAATVAARETAAAIIQEADLDAGGFEHVARSVARNHGVPPEDVEVHVRTAAGRGDYLVVEVSVRMPAISVPGLVEVDGWTYNARQHRRLDDYRSR
jgi:hypothetical protein